MLPAVNDSHAGQERLRCAERAVALTPADAQRAVVPGAARGLGAASFGVPAGRRANTRVCAAS
jgi:hypothetical protein